MKTKVSWMIIGCLVLGLCLLAGLLFGLSRQAYASQQVTIGVDTTVDDTAVNGNCTLREAIEAANSDSAVDACPAGNGKDTILLPAGVYSLTLSGNGEDSNKSGDLDIRGDLRIVGEGLAISSVSANGSDRVFHILNPAMVEFSDVSIMHGGSVEEGGGIYSEGVLTLTQVLVDDNESLYRGGGIYNGDSGVLNVFTSTVKQNQVSDLPPGGCMGGGIRNEGSLYMQASAVIANSAYCGGGIHNMGVLTLTNSTVSGNIAAFEGGISSEGQAMLTNVTVAENEARDLPTPGGGIVGTATLVNTIVSNNLGGNCIGSITSAGHNIDSEDTCGFDQESDFVKTDPRLGPLQDNGGGTLTQALIHGSPAIDAGDNALCTPTDQRGVKRPQGPGCDIGAFEVEVFSLCFPFVAKSPVVEVVVTGRGETTGYPQAETGRGGDPTLALTALPSLTRQPLPTLTALSTGAGSGLGMILGVAAIVIVLLIVGILAAKKL
jgi:CSLREA domain-containing protein